MKIAFTTSGETLDAPLDSRFGRAPRFLVFNTDDDSFVMVDNTQNLKAAQGAGIQSAMNAVRAGADAVISGHCGPKAFRVLKEAGLKIYTSDAASVADALARFRAGELVETTSPDVEGHWV